MYAGEWGDVHWCGVRAHHEDSQGGVVAFANEVRAAKQKREKRRATARLFWGGDRQVGVPVPTYASKHAQHHQHTDLDPPIH
jgi:hypothetical protein